jgi:hypothetical protein
MFLNLLSDDKFFLSLFTIGSLNGIINLLRQLAKFREQKLLPPNSLMFSFLPSLSGQFWAKGSDGGGTAGGNSGIDRLGTIWQEAANLANDDDGIVNVNSLNGQTNNNNKDDFGEYSVADAETIAQQSMLPTFQRTGQNDVS